MPDPKKDEQYSALRTGGMLLAIPALLIVSPLVGFFVGGAVDRWLHTSPWFTLIGLVLGFVAGARETYLIYRRYQEEADKESTRRRP